MTSKFNLVCIVYSIYMIWFGQDNIFFYFNEKNVKDNREYFLMRIFIYVIDYFKQCYLEEIKVPRSKRSITSIKLQKVFVMFYPFILKIEINYLF